MLNAKPSIYKLKEWEDYRKGKKLNMSKMGVTIEKNQTIQQNNPKRKKEECKETNHPSQNYKDHLILFFFLVFNNCTPKIKTINQVGYLQLKTSPPMAIVTESPSSPPSSWSIAQPKHR